MKKLFVGALALIAGAQTGKWIYFALMKTFLLQLSAILRRIIGAPDYEAYLTHVRVHHPGTSPLTREAFVRERLAARYSRPGARCC